MGTLLRSFRRNSSCPWPVAIATLCLAIVPAAGCASAPAAPAKSELFDHHQIVLKEISAQPTVVSGFFSGGDVAEVAVLHRDAGGNVQVLIHAFEYDAWRPVLAAELDAATLFVDVLRVGERDRLIAYKPGQLSWFDTEVQRERLLIAVNLNFRSMHQSELPVVDISHDLNSDGRDDLLMPQLDGFWLSVQRRDGAFNEAMKIGPPEPFRNDIASILDDGEAKSDEPRTYGQIGITTSTLPLYLGRLHQLDYNQDGRRDIAFWDKDHFAVHLQGEDGLFSAAAVSFAPAVPFDSDGIYSYAFKFEDEGALGTILGWKARSQHTVLRAVQDLSGDGVEDLLTVTLSGRSLIRQKSVYHVYFGRPIADGIAFASEPDVSLYPSGKGGAMAPWGYASQRFEDFDGDGQADLMFADVNVGLTGMVRALAGNSVSINLEFFRGQAGTFSERASAKRPVRRFAPLAGLGNVFFPSVSLGDVTGDGYFDLLVGHSPDELLVFAGEPGPGLFAKMPQKIAVNLPADERMVTVANLNRDHKRDLIIQLAPEQGEAESAHSLVLLVAH